MRLTTTYKRIRDGRSKAEQVVQEIFREILQLEDVHPDDNFLNIGGDSLSAMRVINRVEARLDRKVSIRAFLKNPTIRGLSEQLQ